MKAGLETGVLRGVSRSFYLSLRFLPQEMRRPAAIGYLLARTSDTIADSAEIGWRDRMGLLDAFSADLDVGKVPESFPIELIHGTPDPKEKLLLERKTDVFSALYSLPEKEITLIREVVGIITSGQQLDLERFGDATASNPVALSDAAALEDYAWRVAGCVGKFWTKLGYETLGERFSKHAPEELLPAAVQYGKGLQLVNILRDLTEDLDSGRCYLPVADPNDDGQVLAAFSKWRKTALEWVGEGRIYSKKLEMKRLRVASALPAMIAEETLILLDGADMDSLRKRIRIPRSKVYRLVAGAFLRG